jgi:hypothetical protein
MFIQNGFVIELATFAEAGNRLRSQFGEESPVAIGSWLRRFGEVPRDTVRLYLFIYVLDLGFKVEVFFDGANI